MFFGWGSGWLANALPPVNLAAIHHTWWEWVLFAGVVITLLVIDLKGHKHDGPMPMRTALRWSLIWITLAMVFMAGIFWQDSKQAGLEFLAGYLVEKSLSVDNLFVFLVIFRFFKIPGKNQHRVLFWGVLSAIAMRAVLILFCVELVHYFSFIFYIFGAILLWSAFKMSKGEDHDANPEHSWVVKLARKIYPFTTDFEGDRFFVLRDGRRMATQLFLVLIIVEASDLMFAVDSIPAVLAISQDYFIVLTSNVFAILGLRALYFVLHGLMDKFRFLNIGLALILAFIGFKLIFMPKEGIDQAFALKVPIEMTLLVIGGILTSSILASVLIPLTPKEAEEFPTEAEVEAEDRAALAAEASPAIPETAEAALDGTEAPPAVTDDSVPPRA